MVVTRSTLARTVPRATWRSSDAVFTTFGASPFGRTRGAALVGGGVAVLPAEGVATSGDRGANDLSMPLFTAVGAFASLTLDAFEFSFRPPLDASAIPRPATTAIAAATHNGVHERCVRCTRAGGWLARAATIRSAPSLGT